MKKKILFLTGTRADFGKMKPLIRTVQDSQDFECSIFATGMHTMSRYGFTVDEIHKAGFRNVYSFMNQVEGEPMEIVLANTVSGLSRYLHQYQADLLVLHGDRVEALAGAIVGALRNLRTAHIEGGEVSGAVDGLIRHSVSKLAHVHFVTNGTAFDRLRQLGEDAEAIYEIGSPDIDVMLSDTLPALEVARNYYGLEFPEYAIVLYHPVTTELERISADADELVAALLDSGDDYLVIYPNNDQGSHQILDVYQRFRGNKRFKIFPSLRFEYFLTFLQHAQYVIGNSSAGIHEAPVFAVPSINVGSRQRGRFVYESIADVPCRRSALLEAIDQAKRKFGLRPCRHFGKGESSKRFMQALRSDRVWVTPTQKSFFDLPPLVPALGRLGA